MIDDDLHGFLAVIDTAFLASASAAGEPYVQHRGGPRGFIKALDDRTLGFLDLAGNRQYLTVGNPIKMSDSPTEVKRSPLLGEHTDEVMRELGYAPETIAALRAENVI